MFRFVTFRSPEQLSIKDKNIRFVIHPDMSKSVIKTCPIPSPGEDSTKKFQEYLKQFKAINTVPEIRAINPELFDLGTLAYKKKINISDLTTIENLLTIENEILLFDQIFYQVISKENNYVRQAASLLLIINHALKFKDHLIEFGLKKLTGIKIEIPYQVMECFKPWWFSRCGGSLEGVQNLGIADFRRVEQEVCCYVPGEVSHIENVMAKEYKERSTRNYVRTENTIETTKETEIENLTDVTTATRNELCSEVAQVLEQDRSNSYGGSLGVSAEYMGAQINVNAYADFATSNSSSYSNIEAKTYAEEVTKRALERIVQRTSEKRTSKIIKEFEENNKHGFDNRAGEQHVTGIYRWLDIMYKNRLINYGKRLMVEFMTPEPAEFYKRILKYKSVETNSETTKLPDPPQNLSEFGINKPEDINKQNVYNVASYYGITISSLPVASLELTINLSPLSPVDHNRHIDTQSLSPINVPNEYEVDKIIGSYTYSYQAGSALSSQRAFCDFTFGGKIVNSGFDYSGTKKNKTVNINLDLNPNLAGSIPVGVAYSGCWGFYGAVNVNCILKGSVIKDWQTDCYNKFLTAYNTKLNEYNQAIADANQKDETAQIGDVTESSNTTMNRIIEQRELKRICIEMLVKPYCRVQGQKNYSDINACDLYQIPQVNQTQEYTQYASMVKFFEQAIDWQIMSYIFYPYYWASKCVWADLMKSESDDLVFQAFLQSGMARVVVPIRLQYTEAFAFYLETGDIWLGNELVSGTQNDLYLSIAEEMQTVEGTVEEEWISRVPSTLAIIQGKSAYLEQEGLPCCGDVENSDTTSGIIKDENTLQIINP